MAAPHTLVIRVLTEDGELIDTTSDFAEDAAYDFFDSVVLSCATDEVVQLIDTADDRVLSERIVGA